MRKLTKFSSGIALAVAIAIPSSVFAQKLIDAPRSFHNQPVTATWQPKFTLIQPGEPGSPQTAEAIKAAKKAAAKTPRKVIAGGTELWANRVAATGVLTSRMGIYSLNTNDPGTQTPLIYANTMNFNYKISLQGDRLYGVYYNYLTTIDTEKWTNLGRTQMQTNPFMATASTSTPDGRTFGQYWSPVDATSAVLVYGWANFADMTRTTIRETDQYKQMAVMGYASDGSVYGITVWDSKLYKIDTETGIETEIGDTEVPILKQSNMSFNNQAGGIDTRDNTFYWIASDTLGVTTLRTVNLLTAKTEVLYTFTGGESFSSLVVPPPAAANDAPAKATDLAASFIDDALAGTFSFVAPTSTYTGGELTGTLTYTVSENGTTLATGNVEAGDTATINLTVAEGQHTFTVITTNAAGNSPKAELTTYVGNDTPGAPFGLTFNADEGNLTNTVSWISPVLGTHGGYLGTLTYDLYRIFNTDTTQVCQDYVYEGEGNQISYVDKLDKLPMGLYKYQLVIKNGKYASAPTVSAVQVLGAAFDIPYNETFSNATLFGKYTVINVNNDVRKFTRSSLNGGYLYYNNSTTEIPDEWLITPPINLKAGKTYILTIVAGNATSNRLNYIEARLGQGRTVDDMTQTIMQGTAVTVTGRTNEFVTDNITVEKDGAYNLGYHLYADAANQGAFNTYRISLEQGPDLNAPDSVTNLVVTPGEKGALKANIKLNAPEKDFAGDALVSRLTKVEVLRDGKAVLSVNDVTPGTELEFIDNNGLTRGVHTYSAIAYNDNGAGREGAEVSVFIGNDIPGMVTGLRADDKQSTITLSWNPVSEQGQNGGYVDPETTDYIVWDTRVVNNQIYLNEKVDSVRGITQSTFDYFTEEGDQHLERWAVQTKNDIGTGSAYALELMVGESYPMPIEEHLDGQQTHYYWIYDTMLGQTRLYYSDQASDGDGYAFELRGLTAGEIGSLSSGKILMGTDLNPTVTLGKQNAPIVAASKPILTFDVKSSSTVNPLVVRILKPDGTFGTDVVLGVPGSEYENISVDLSQYADLHHVRFLLTGYFDEAGSFYFDNIQVKDDAATGIADVQLSQDGKPANIYTVDGRLVRRNATGTTGLPQGIYIMGNQKVVVK